MVMLHLSVITIISINYSIICVFNQYLTHRCYRSCRGGNPRGSRRVTVVVVLPGITVVVVLVMPSSGVVVLVVGVAAVVVTVEYVEEVLFDQEQNEQ